MCNASAEAKRKQKARANVHSRPRGEKCCYRVSHHNNSYNSYTVLTQQPLVKPAEHPCVRVGRYNRVLIDNLYGAWYRLFDYQFLRCTLRFRIPALSVPFSFIFLCTCTLFISVYYSNSPCTIHTFIRRLSKRKYSYVKKRYPFYELKGKKKLRTKKMRKNNRISIDRAVD